MPPELLNSEFTVRPPGRRAAPQRGRSGLGGILDDRFAGELDRLSESQPDLETRFLEALRSPVNFEDFRGELSEFAESVTSDVFGPGGQVSQLTGQARQGAIGRGLSPFGGTAVGARNRILEGATGDVSRAIGQQAGQLAGLAVQQRQSDLGNLLGFTGMQAERADNLRESLFGGQATIENLNLARESQGLNRRLIEQALSERQGGGGIGGFLGKVGGGLLGSALGPIGSALGAKAGEELTGALFG